jgi:hypothetical protein
MIMVLAILEGIGETEVLEVLAMGLHTTERSRLHQIGEGLRADAPASAWPLIRPHVIRGWTRHSREP